MCGISGVWSTRPLAPIDLDSALQAMIRCQTLRGPDAEGLWEGDSIRIGHNRLAIIDPENRLADQPLETKRFVLSFNGEIYNYRALKADLKALDVPFTTQSDTEVLLKAIDFWGVEGALDRVNGIFAFAVYDKKERLLWIVRDRLGVKPLYYRHQNGVFWFASNPAAIVQADLRASWQLDRSALFDFFELGAPNGARTLFRHINRVLPGELVRITLDGAVRRSRYWTPQFRDNSVEESIERACRLQREAHVPSALFLSGGVDSTVMSCFLDDLDFFHLDSPERKYAEYVAEKSRKSLVVSAFSSSLEFEDLNDRYVKFSGEPSGSAPIPMLISKAMHSSGYKVAFSANGADELFFGYPRTPAPELSKGNLPSSVFEVPPASTHMEQRNHIFRTPGCFFIPGTKVEDRTWERDLVTLDSGFPASAHNRWFELQTYVAFDLNATLDFASMAYSLEVRVPFLDHELVESALSKRADEFICCDYGRKAPLKKVLKKHGMSPLLWYRPKIGFSVPRKILQRRRKQLDQALFKLAEEDYLKLGPGFRRGSRDHQYLAAAAHSFLAWKSEWIDSGVVSP
ncbi:MAG: asparagine synthase (glutamine-hydrolyzing) [Pseudomonadales bacterium]